MTEEIIDQKQDQLYKVENELTRLSNEQATVESQLEAATRSANDAERLIQLKTRYNELPSLTKDAQVKVATAKIDLIRSQKTVASNKLSEAENIRGEKSEALRVEIEETQTKVNELLREREYLTSDVANCRFTVDRLDNSLRAAEYDLGKLIREQTNREKPVSSAPEYIYFGKNISAFDH